MDEALLPDILRIHRFYPLDSPKTLFSDVSSSHQAYLEAEDSQKSRSLLPGRPPMWSIDTAWFDVAMIGVGFAVGNILFGRFEEHRPRWRRLLKLSLVLALTLLLATTVGRGWAYGWMLLPAAAAIWVHLVWLPRRGINGWTAEPRAEYLALVKHATLRDLFR